MSYGRSRGSKADGSSPSQRFDPVNLTGNPRVRVTVDVQNIDPSNVNVNVDDMQANVNEDENGNENKSENDENNDENNNDNENDNDTNEQNEEKSVMFFAFYIVCFCVFCLSCCILIYRLV